MNLELKWSSDLGVCRTGLCKVIFVMKYVQGLLLMSRLVRSKICFVNIIRQLSLLIELNLRLEFKQFKEIKNQSLTFLLTHFVSLGDICAI